MNTGTHYFFSLVVIICSSWSVTHAVPTMGKFRTFVDSVTLAPESVQTKIQHRFQLRKTGKKSSAIFGSFDIKEEIGPIGLLVFLEKWGSGGFKPFAMDRVKIDSVCKNKDSFFIMKRFNGTAENISPDCKLKPMKTYLFEKDVDGMVHEYAQSVVYGKFRANVYFVQGEEKLAGFTVVCRFEPL